VVEKGAALGGWAARLWKRVPFRAPYAEPQDTGVAELVARVTAHPRITCTSIRRSPRRAARPGASAQGSRRRAAPSPRKRSGPSSDDRLLDLRHRRLPELGGGQPNVVDQAGLEALAVAAKGGAIRRADGREVGSVAFVQCAGQRDESGTHLPYCSGHCCATSIKQAMYFKDANPEADTVVLYSDLRVPGMARTSTAARRRRA